MSWEATKGLRNFRSQIELRFPHRDRASDGFVGDLKHQQERSGHNPDRTGNAEYRDGDALDEVRAWDMDSDLRDPHGVTAATLVGYLVGLGRNGVYLPFRYIIFARTIYRKTNGWAAEKYTGASPHIEHVHFSGDYSEKADNWNGDLGIASLGIPKPTTEELDMDEDKVKAIVKEALAEWAKVDPLASIAARTNSTENKRLPRLEEMLTRIEDKVDSLIVPPTEEPPPAG